MASVSLPDEVRAACAWVAGQSRFVRLEEERIEAYARSLAGTGDLEEAIGGAGDPEAAAAFAICMNAINFGSGWWPTIRKRPGYSGYATMAAGVEDRFAGTGPWSAGELASIDAESIARVVGQDPEHPLMAQFAAALRDVGEHLLAEPFFKRAQLAAADLHRAGVADLPGVQQLTAFADNLVPHVLRVDSVLHLDPDLTARIEAEDLLIHGSPEEVELRACSVHAIELLAAACDLNPAEIDSALWNRGRGRRYKSLPRPRSRNIAY